MFEPVHTEKNMLRIGPGVGSVVNITVAVQPPGAVYVMFAVPA
jgi:hypothetical protein